jgi:hypothetical protein
LDGIQNDQAWIYAPEMIKRLNIEPKIVKGAERLENWYTRRDLDDTRQAHVEYLDENSKQMHLTLQIGKLEAEPLEQPFGTFLNFEHLIFGHFHKPQKSPNSSHLTIDDGVILSKARTPVITALQINPSGSIGFLPGLSH